MDDAVADMLLAEPRRIATAQTDVQEHVEDKPLSCAERPMLFELLDQLDGPCQMAFTIAAINLDAVSRVLVAVHALSPI
jgi:hypothetical protein